MRRRELLGLSVSLLIMGVLSGCANKEAVPVDALEPVTVVETESETIEESTEESVEESIEESIEESTETIEETEEETNPYNITDCDPITKYTNTDSNIRAIPDKSGDLITSVAINTELTVTGTTDNGWSRIEREGVECFIKSSLLSDSKTEVKQPTSNKPTDQSGNQGVSTPSTVTPSVSTPSTVTEPVPDPSRAGRTHGGTGGYDGGTTGSQTPGGLGGAY